MGVTWWERLAWSLCSIGALLCALVEHRQIIEREQETNDPRMLELVQELDSVRGQNARLEPLIKRTVKALESAAEECPNGDSLRDIPGFPKSEPP